MTEWLRFCRRPPRWEPNRFLSHMPTDITSELCATPVSKFALCFPFQPLAAARVFSAAARTVRSFLRSFFSIKVRVDPHAILERPVAAARIRDRAATHPTSPPPCNDGARRTLQSVYLPPGAVPECIVRCISRSVRLPRLPKTLLQPGLL